MKSNLAFRPTVIEDTQRLLRTWDVDEVNLLSGVPKALRDGSQELLTIINEDTDEVMAIAGLAHLWTGVAEVWVILSNAAIANPMKVVRGARAVLGHWQWEHSLHRIQAMGVQGEKIQTWMRILGLQQEGVLRSFGAKGEDYGVFSRIEKYGR